MIISVVIAALIFGYAGWAVWRGVKKSNEGKCSGCHNTPACCKEGVNP
jgi:hypothetical protein